MSATDNYRDYETYRGMRYVSKNLLILVCHPATFFGTHDVVSKVDRETRDQHFDITEYCILVLSTLTVVLQLDIRQALTLPWSYALDYRRHFRPPPDSGEHDATSYERGSRVGARVIVMN